MLAVDAHILIAASFVSHGSFLSLESPVIVWVPATFFAWILAFRRALGDAFLGWDGETAIDAPQRLRRDQERLEDDWSPEGLHDERPRPVWPESGLPGGQH